MTPTEFTSISEKLASLYSFEDKISCDLASRFYFLYFISKEPGV